MGWFVIFAEKMILISIPRYLGGVESYWGNFGDTDSTQNDLIESILYKKSKLSSAIELSNVSEVHEI